MKGVVLDFSIQQNQGVISGDDGKRYPFFGSNWKLDRSPSQGTRVDFEVNSDGQAIDIYQDIDSRSPISSLTSNSKVDAGEAVLWFVCCMPIGFMRYGQTGKGWVWVLIAIASGGLGAIPAWIDYWMCFSAQQNRSINEWEFFPGK